MSGEFINDRWFTHGESPMSRRVVREDMVKWIETSFGVPTQESLVDIVKEAERIAHEAAKRKA
jgi:hypothetical protein